MIRRAAVTICLSVVVLAIGADGAGARRIPVHSVVIGSGRLEGKPWSASIARAGGRAGQGAKGRLRPCIYLPDVGACHVENQTPNSEPLVAEDGEVSRSDKSTLVGIAFRLGIARAKLVGIDGSERTMGVRSLTRTQARKARLARFGYLVFVVPRPYCVNRMVLYDAEGKAVTWGRVQSGTYCPAHKGPTRR